MGIRYDESKKKWVALYSKRDPITRKPHTLKRMADTKSQAARIHTELILQINQKIRAKKVPAWKRFLEDYFKDRTLRVQPSTIYSEKMTVDRHTLSWNDRLIDSIQKSDIHNLINNDLTDKSDSHKKYILKIVRGAFNYAVERDLVTHNPTPLIKFRAKEKIKSVLTEPQARIFLEKAREVGSEWYPIWVTALYTGMRNGELYALKWDCVDLDVGKIKVARSWNNQNGFKETKSGDDRIIDISPGLMPLMRELYIKQINDFVLPRIHKWDKGEQARDLRAFLMGVGLPTMRFHDLRASWATILLSQGIQPAKVMKMGGWKDIETMMIYVEKAGIDVAGALNGLKLHDHVQVQAEVINFQRPV